MSSGEDSSQHRNVWVDSYSNLQINNFSGMQATQEANTFMKSAKPIQYEFIPSTDRLNNNDGFCVSDVMIGIYSSHIPTLDLKRFTDLCLRVRHLGNDTYEEYLANQKWKLEDGVTPKMLYEICKILNISHYSYDITNKCFLKYVTKTKNYPALVYYCVNSHMYHVENKEMARKLAMGAKDIEHKIKSHVLEEETGVKNNKYATKQIVENIDINDITQEIYKDTICIYSKSCKNLIALLLSISTVIVCIKVQLYLFIQI
jgi:hypothetical protein